MGPAPQAVMKTVRWNKMIDKGVATALKDDKGRQRGYNYFAYANSSYGSRPSESKPFFQQQQAQ